MEENKERYSLKEVCIRLKVKEGDSLYSTEKIDCPDKAVKLLADFMKDLDRECVYVLNFDKKMHPISFNMAAMGGINYAAIEPANIFKSAILSNAGNIMILHVHPSGDFTPSKSDMEMTQMITLAGSVMGIPIQDHLIVAGGTGKFISLRETHPELFEAQAKVAESRALVSESPMAVAEPQPAQSSAAIYNEVMSLIEHQKDIMTKAPEAWKLANEIAGIAFASANRQLDLHEYDTQRMITDTADKIRNNDIGSIISTLGDIGEKSPEIALVKTVLDLVVRLGSYDSGWEKAPEEVDKIFTKTEAKETSFADKLKAKSTESAMINAGRREDRHEAIQQPSL